MVRFGASVYLLGQILGALVLIGAGVMVFQGQSSAAAEISIAVGGVGLLLLSHAGRIDATNATEHARKKAVDSELLQSQLDEQRRTVDSFADGLEVAICICDPRGTIVYANRGLSELFRFESPVGRQILAVTLSHDLEGIVQEAFRGQNPLKAEMAFSYPEERVGMVKAWVPSATSRQVFVSIFDITDLRRLERVRKDFVANVSHELRTPLTIIRAMAETLLDEDEDVMEVKNRYLPKIISEVDRLSSISQDLLILSSAEGNPVRKQACDIAEVFSSVTAQLKSKAEQKNLTLTYEGPKRRIVEANTSQMIQVAINLIDNALIYTPEGSVEVVLVEEQNSVEIKVKDTGTGIAQEQVSRIFERFYRIDRARSRATGGNGLGLSIVKHIVEAHGGTVTVESAFNVGSTFTVTLPVGRVESGPSEI